MALSIGVVFLQLGRCGWFCKSLRGSVFRTFFLSVLVVV